MSKKELRLKYKLLRQELSDAEISEKSEAIATNLKTLNIWGKNVYHVFLTINTLKEVETSPIIRILNELEKQIVISKSDFETRSMQHFLWTESTVIENNQFQIPEPIGGVDIKPETLEVVFVPLLAYDVIGNRVGYGKGFYDAFLSQCKPDVVKIGLSFFEAEPRFEFSEPHDVLLDFCITPNQVYTF